MRLLEQYAQETCSGYCAGCDSICEAAAPNGVPVSDIMRYLMYYRSYGERDRARGLFAALPKGCRERLVGVDYSRLEKVCPQGLPIGRLMREAKDELAGTRFVT